MLHEARDWLLNTLLSIWLSSGIVAPSNALTAILVSIFLSVATMDFPVSVSRLWKKVI